MGNFSKQPWLGRSPATVVFSRGYVEKEGLKLAPREERKYEFADGETGREYFLQGVNTRGDFGFASGGHRRLQGANRLPKKSSLQPILLRFLNGFS